MSLDTDLKDLLGKMLHDDLSETIKSAEYLGRLLWHNHMAFTRWWSLKKISSRHLPIACRVGK